MANADRPSGFRPYGTPKAVIPMIAGGTVAPGEFVSVSSDGKCDPVAAGATIYGLCLTAGVDDSDILVSVDPEQLYVGQANGAEVNLQTDIGNVVDILATADNTVYNESRMEVDTASLSTSDGQLVLLAIDRRPDNAFGASVDCLVKVNEHQMITSFAGI